VNPKLRSSKNRCLANWATVVCQKEELSTHWISLYLSYPQDLELSHQGGKSGPQSALLWMSSSGSRTRLRSPNPP